MTSKKDFINISTEIIKSNEDENIKLVILGDNDITQNILLQSTFIFDDLFNTLKSKVELDNIIKI